MSITSNIFGYIAVFLFVFTKTSVADDEIPLVHQKVSTLAQMIYSAEESPPVPHKPLTEYALDNGMQIFLQPTQVEKGEFHFQLFAPGGFTSLPKEERTVGWAASKVTWESGVDGRTADELMYNLIDRDIGIRITTHLFQRTIEASGPVSELPHCLSIIKSFLTQPQFTDEGLKNGVRRAIATLDKKARRGNSQGLRDIFLLTNMSDWDILKPNSPHDLKEVSIEKVALIFKKLYSNPAEFNLALVGDIDAELVKQQITETLGTLPKTSQYLPPVPKAPVFPEGLKQQFDGYRRYYQSLTRITFPMTNINIDLYTLDVLTTHLSRKIKSLVSNVDTLKNEITINYEFPQFPSLGILWIEVQFSSSKSQIEPYSQLIFKGLEKIRNELNEDDIAMSILDLKRRRSIPLDLTGELLVLSNYIHSGRNQDNLFLTKYDASVMLKKVRSYYPNLNSYSIITLHP